jgi:dCMP deaminase
MGQAFWIASKSKDPATQVGAIIISKDNLPLGSGYNGPPRQILDTSINWDRPDKYDYMCHAEENAIDYSLVGSLHEYEATIYVTAKPCPKCMLRIVKEGIRKVVYYPMSRKSDSASSLACEEMHKKVNEIARLGDVDLEEFDGNLNWMRDRMKWMESIGIFD